jgi:Kef-type K+ transport system membrane component KefB
MNRSIQSILFVVAIIVLVSLWGTLNKQLDLPSGTFQLLAGILLGPSVFNLLEKPVILGTWGSISPSPLHSALKILAEIGPIQVMFFAGMKTDWGELRRYIDGISKVGAWGFGLSAAATAIVARLFLESWTRAHATL